MQEQIKAHFKAINLPKPISINHVGKWAHGEVYAVTCGIIRVKKYAVYVMDGEIVSVRRR